MPTDNALPSPDALLASYQEMFGYLPELPAARVALEAEIAPEFLLIFEQLRAHALYSEILDPKTTQLISFAVLASHANAAARHHAIAARRAGATWEELHKVLEIVCVHGALHGTQMVAGMLSTLRSEETAGAQTT